MHSMHILRVIEMTFSENRRPWSEDEMCASIDCSSCKLFLLLGCLYYSMLAFYMHATCICHYYVYFISPFFSFSFNLVRSMTIPSAASLITAQNGTGVKQIGKYHSNANELYSICALKRDAFVRLVVINSIHTNCWNEYTTNSMPHKRQLISMHRRVQLNVSNFPRR